MTKETKLEQLKKNSFISKQDDYTAVVEYDQMQIGKVRYVRPLQMAQLVNKYPQILTINKLKDQKQIEKNPTKFTSLLKKLTQFKNQLAILSIVEWVFDEQINDKNFSDIAINIQTAFNMSIQKHQQYWNSKKFN